MPDKDSRLTRAGVSGYNKQDYKVYVHQRASDGEIFYVGKGRRWRENQKRNRNQHWHNIVNKHGLSVVVVASHLTNEEACTLERVLIKELSKTNDLVNYTLGGDGSEGYVHSEEIKAKIKGRKFSEEHRKKLSEAKKKNPSMYWLGKSRDEETKQKVSEGLKNYHADQKQQSSECS